MKKILISLFLLSTTLSNIFAANELPKIPGNCFNTEVYCVSNDVTNNEEGKRVIRVQLFAKVDAAEYSSYQDIINKFFAFNQWPTYAEDSKDVAFFASKEIEPIVVNGQKVRRHLAHYETGAPFPFRKMEVYEVANYFPLETYNGALVSYKFVADVSNPQTKGIKHKVGILHMSLNKDTNEFYLYLTIDIVPSIDLLPKIAAPYIERAMMGIFLGMFNLR